MRFVVDSSIFDDFGTRDVNGSALERPCVTHFLLWWSLSTFFEVRTNVIVLDPVSGKTSQWFIVHSWLLLRRFTSRGVASCHAYHTCAAPWHVGPRLRCFRLASSYESLLFKTRVYKYSGWCKILLQFYMKRTCLSNALSAAVACCVQDPTKAFSPDHPPQRKR